VSDTQALPQSGLWAESVAELHCRCSDGRVALAGELDLATIPRLDQALRRVATAAGDAFLDLRKLDFIEVCGAQFILEADRRMRRGGGRLVVVRGSAELDRLFALTGIDRLIQLVDCPPNDTGPRSSVPAGAGPDLCSAGPGLRRRRPSARQRLTKERTPMPMAMAHQRRDPPRRRAQCRTRSITTTRSRRPRRRTRTATPRTLHPKDQQTHAHRLTGQLSQAAGRPVVSLLIRTLLRVPRFDGCRRTAEGKDVTVRERRVTARWRHE